ncbi:MarR family winged helix-turn-helix transcriptional regulator [Lysinimonas soli]|uniref:MarR family winged helix-turn-helix transcriptional regulator n=1 Tax=Lysinimonas soli TaxID=1074233 RepID=A0ABW0NRW9_9MICO
MARDPDLDSLVQLSWRVFDVLDDTARRHELSPTQLRLLAILRDREPEMLELAAHLGLDKSSTSGLVARAEGRGLVQRVPSDSDRRRVAVRLTDAGRAQATVLEQESYAALGAIMDRLPTDQRSAFAAICRELLKRVG